MFMSYQLRFDFKLYFNEPICMKTLVSTIVAILSLTVAPAQAERQLRFGVYSSDKPTTMVRIFRPVLNALEVSLTEKLGESVQISLQVASTYDKGIDDLTSGRVDFARMGPASYVISKERDPKLNLLAMENRKGSKTFYGIICVPEQSPIKEVRQLKGRSFAFGDERSTIGRYLAQQLLKEHGVYAEDLARFEYLGRHDRVGTAVGSSQFDAGALKESTFKKLQTRGVKIRELVRFPNVTKPWIASSRLSGDILSQLKESLLELKDSTALNALGKDGFLPAKDTDYEIIREAMQNNDAFFQQTHN